MNRVQFLLFLVSLTITSCNPQVDIERLEKGRFFSLSAIISPNDSLTQVHVYQGQSLGMMTGLDSALVRKANVSLSDGTQMYQLVYAPPLKSYIFSTFRRKIESGKTYQLLVSLPENNILSSSCTVPEKPSPINVLGTQNNQDYNFEVKWSPGEINRYFMITYEILNIKLPFISDPTQRPYFPVSSDEQVLFDRQTSPSTGIDQTLRNAYRADSISLKISLYSLSPSLYNYLKTRYDYEKWQSNTEGIIPNLREPQSVYSNIIGGYGILGAYVRRDTVIKIK